MKLTGITGKLEIKSESCRSCTCTRKKLGRTAALFSFCFACFSPRCPLLGFSICVSMFCSSLLLTFVKLTFDPEMLMLYFVIECHVHQEINKQKKQAFPTLNSACIDKYHAKERKSQKNARRYRSVILLVSS